MAKLLSCNAHQRSRTPLHVARSVPCSNSRVLRDRRSVGGLQRSRRSERETPKGKSITVHRCSLAHHLHRPCLLGLGAAANDGALTAAQLVAAPDAVPFVAAFRVSLFCLAPAE